MLHAVAPRPQAALAKDKERLLAIIKERSFLTKGGPFKLASGAMSDYYLDMKPTTFSPEGLALIGEIAFSMVRDDPRRRTRSAVWSSERCRSSAR